MLDNLVNNTSSNSEGFVLFNELKRCLNRGQKVILEISGESTLSSSFLNSSIGEYLDNFGMETFKENVKIKSNKNQFQRLSKYLSNYSKVYGNRIPEI